MVSVAVPMSSGRLTRVERPAVQRGAQPGGQAFWAGQGVGGQAEQGPPQPVACLRAEWSRDRAAAGAPAAGAVEAGAAGRARLRKLTRTGGPAGAGSGLAPRVGLAGSGLVTGAVGEQERAGQPVQGGPVHVPGHHRHHRGITRRRLRLRAGDPPRLRHPPGRPGSLGRRPARQPPQLGQRHMQQHLSRLPRTPRHHPGPDQPPARLLQRIMAALRTGAGILRPGLPAQRLQHRGQGGGTPRGQVSLGTASATEGDPQPEPPVPEPVLGRVDAAITAAPLIHLPGQAAERGQARAAPGRRDQDFIGVAEVLRRQPVGPVAQVPRPRGGQIPGGQRPGDRRMGRQSPSLAHRSRGGSGGDPALPLQPGARRAMAVIFEPALNRERAKHPGPRGGVLGLRPGQGP